MKKLLSFIIASALSLSSVGAVFAAPNVFGIEPETTVDVGLDVKIKGTTGEYGDYATAENPYISYVVSLTSEGTINAKATLDMSEVAAKWNEYIDAAVSKGVPRATALGYTELDESRFYLKVTTNPAITNIQGRNLTLSWSDKARELFEQEGLADYEETVSGNTYTVTMKVKGTNAQLDAFFNSNPMAEISLEIPGTTVTGIGGPYAIESEFTGTIDIDVPGDENDMVVRFSDTDTNYVKQLLASVPGPVGGGGVVRPVATPTPTVAPTEAPTATPEPQLDGTANGAKLNYEDHYAYIIGYDDQYGKDEVRPENPITRAEVATIFYRLLDDESREKFRTQENEFSDVNEGDWYNNNISTVAAAGIVNGYDDGTFLPNNKITRAEFATIAARFTSLVHEGENLFTDIDGHWAAEYINNAAITGWVNGYDDGTFKPNAEITRAEAITLINRVLYRYVLEEDLHEDMIVWSDNTPDKWYYTAVQEATNSHEYDREHIGEYETHTAITEPHDWESHEQ
ncbi:MAG: S-layer homology domain-containing protein [Clostridia bacterium]|nr:S-layer homology domain-containing protein [Clostridia bacterium]